MIGINTDEEVLEEGSDRVLIVTNYNEQDKVVFKHLKNSSEITLDLLTHKIHGIVLDGGSW